MMMSTWTSKHVEAYNNKKLCIKLVNHQDFLDQLLFKQ